MENEKEKKYFIIWLYISILLHVLVVIIMLSIKPTKDPDPASKNFQPAQVILVPDEPIIQSVQDEPIEEDFKLAKREQGGSTALEHTQTNPKDAQQDIPTPALSTDYKNALQNQTKITDQDDEGNVNILDNATIDQEEQYLEQNIDFIEKDFSKEQEVIVQATNQEVEITKNMQQDIQQSAPGNTLQTIMQEQIEKRIEKTETQPTPINKEAPVQPHIQKIISKKHRPADLGQENLAKIQLSKPAEEMPVQKKKISLQDIQNGFSQFIKNGSTVQTNTVPTASVLGNSLFFSTDGNSDKDDIAGLKRASYMHQIGQMYQNAGREYIDTIINVARKDGLPHQNNYVAITIERSGKISSATTTQSCGNSTIDQYHLKAIDAIGDFPPIPKYIEAPMRITAYLPFERIKTIPGKRVYR